MDGDGLPPGETLVAAMADEGYAGTELGPPGYFGDGAEVGRLLGAHGLRLVGSFLPLRFSRAEHMDDDLLALDRTLDLLDAAAGDGRTPGRAALGRLLRAGPRALRRGHRAAPRDLAAAGARARC